MSALWWVLVVMVVLAVLGMLALVVWAVMTSPEPPPVDRRRHPRK